MHRLRIYLALLIALAGASLPTSAHKAPVTTLSVNTHNVAQAIEKPNQELMGGLEPYYYVAGCQHYAELFHSYNWDAVLMMAIAMGESGCNPNRVGDNYPINGLHAPSCGLLQVRTLQGRPTCEQLKDPKTNLDWAYKLYKSGGLGHWTVWKKGLYQRYL